MPRELVIGFHAILSRLRTAPGTIGEIFLDEARADARARDLAMLAERAGVRLIPVASARLDGMAGGARHQGVVATIDAAAPHAPSLEAVLDALDEAALLLVLDGVTDPHNLGACLRVADGARAHAVIAPKDRACGLTPVVRKVASGAAESVPYFMVTNLARTLDTLRSRGLWMIGATEEAKTELFGHSLGATPVAWVLGAEGPGLRRLTREKCDVLIRVPMFGTVESLNVAVTAGICLYETRRQRSGASTRGK